MNQPEWQVENEDLIGELRLTLRKETCPEIIDSFEALAHAIWRLATPFLGAAGTRAVMARSLSLASRDAPLLEKIRVNEEEIDLSEFRAYVASVGCAAPEVMDSLLGVEVAMFRTIEDLVGRAVSQHVLRLVREQKQPQT
ncbi:MAG: hypothetical protein HY675_08825 [Chloroflexi bacterium]|nr:hypothetical protein [Chloroflexota bacterium]